MSSGAERDELMGLDGVLVSWAVGRGWGIMREVLLRCM